MSFADAHGRGALAPPVAAPRWALAPLARLYGAAAAAHQRRRARRRVDVGLPIVSVGNITAGGTGKTPMTQWVVQQLRAMGRRPAVALRGGRGEDEALLHAQALGGAPVAVGADRARAIDQLRTRGEAFDCVVLDDGMQRRELVKRLEIALVDATRDPFRDALLPLGLLREPVDGLARADVIALTRVDLPPAGEAQRLADTLAKAFPAATIAQVELGWSALRIVEAEGEERVETVDWLRGRRVAALCAVGRPAAFFEQLRRAGATVAARLALADHAAMGGRRLRRVRRLLEEAAAKTLVCTEKDWVKLGPALERLGGTAQLGGAAVVRPVLEARFRHGEEAVRRALAEAVEAGASAAETVREGAGGALKAIGSGR